MDLAGWSGEPSSPALQRLVQATRQQLASHGRVLPEEGPEGGGHADQPDTIPLGTVLNGLFEVRREVIRTRYVGLYDGNSVATGERVAIKVLLPEAARSGVIRDRFFEIARRLTVLAHPTIAQYRLAATEPRWGLPYIVYEYVDGIPLESLIGQVTVPEMRLRALIHRVAEPLSYAHGMGLLHLDLGPDNLILPNGILAEARIIDFALIRPVAPLPDSRPAAPPSNPYLAPELFRGEVADLGPWTDVYGLGRIALALTTGSRPGGAVPVADEMAQASSVIGGVIAKMLAEDPGKRLQSMDAVLVALDGSSG